MVTEAITSAYFVTISEWVVETKSVIAKAKHDATKHIYDELDTKEGQVKIYKIAKARQRSRQDKMAVNIIKDTDGTILTDEKLDSGEMEIIL